jgi:hypothetical protein
MKEYEVYSEYREGTRIGKVVRHIENKYWGVHLSDTSTEKSGFLMWHPTKSEYWCEDIAENFCLNMIKQDGTPS